MGYTHYWNMNNAAPDKGKLAIACVAMSKVIEEHSAILGDIRSADFFVTFNGRGADAHEPFSFPGDIEFDFCKTDCKPYDKVVTACLSIAADVLGDGIRVSSDGGIDDWADGTELATRALGRAVENPQAAS